ncbi:MAG: response regulator [Gammaproteobacteria bacterium]|nr:response regulator [Gammaproteobacteria bacterium]
MIAVRKILIVEDHKPLRSLLSFLLSSAGYETVETPDALSALDEVSRQPPDLVLLDWQLPDMEGIKLLRLWRADAATAEIPVIMVSGKADEVDRVTALKAGADDYVIKPFSRDELLARVQAVLRRTGGNRDTTDQDVRRFENISLDVRSLRVTAAETPVHLGPIEFKMLNLFMTHPERVLSRSQIVDRVWRINAHVDERTVDVHIRRLRLALRGTGHDDCIQTVRGVGYRLSRIAAGAAAGAAAGVPTGASETDRAGQRS